mmetsp:Transcript_22068/g.58083  ORF Transcript_22068/g.58083 Transcript_22068/m.58083 type:complete len:205 (+) Transcript_22068:477-1091(+)
MCSSSSASPYTLTRKETTTFLRYSTLRWSAISVLRLVCLSSSLSSPSCRTRCFITLCDSRSISRSVLSCVRSFPTSSSRFAWSRAILNICRSDGAPDSSCVVSSATRASSRAVAPACSAASLISRRSAAASCSAPSALESACAFHLAFQAVTSFSRAASAACSSASCAACAPLAAVPFSRASASCRLSDATSASSAPRALLACR